MSAADFELIAPHLVHVDLPKSEELILPGGVIDYCWFIEDGIASVVAMSREGREAEAGIVGRDGMVDVATILASSTSPLRCFIQISGSGLRIKANILAKAVETSPTMRKQLNQYAYKCLVQVAQTALANASFTVNERLARWLLMCADRVGGNQINLTHEFLSIMLNVRRAGVTLALHALEDAGLVKTSRGSILIVDRPGLEKFGYDAYEPLV